MLRFIEIFVEVISWLKIAASPFIVGSVLGFVWYLYKPTFTGLLFAGTLAAAGLLFGVLFAIKVSRRMRPSDFNARIHRVPEADKVRQE